jgi:hypothetical protein
MNGECNSVLASKRNCGVNPNVFCNNSNFNSTAPCCPQEALAQKCGQLTAFQQANITRT